MDEIQDFLRVSIELPFERINKSIEDGLINTAEILENENEFDTELVDN